MNESLPRGGFSFALLRFLEAGVSLLPYNGGVEYGKVKKKKKKAEKPSKETVVSAYSEEGRERKRKSENALRICFVLGILLFASLILLFFLLRYFNLI